MDDYGIIITPPGVSVVGAPANKKVMDSRYPYLKLDTQAEAAFKTITLSIVNDPPEPVSPALHTYTVVHQFKHGYKYRPAIETLFYVKDPPPSTTFSQRYFLDGLLLSAKTAFDYAAIYAVADDTNVYYIIDKYKNGGNSNLLTGTNLQISSHVFLDGIGI